MNACPPSIASALGLRDSLPRLEEALTHASYVNEHPHCRDYQQLEFLGDAVLGLCVSELLVQSVPSAKEGQLTRMRAALVSTDALASFGRSIDLARHIRLGRGACSDANHPKMLADVLEAIVAAVFLADGLDAARTLARIIVGDSLHQVPHLAARDPKSQLQELVQRDGRPAPTYTLVSTHGPDHDRWFEVHVVVDQSVVACGRGRSKKQAETEAARIAISTLTPKDPQP